MTSGLVSRNTILRAIGVASAIGMLATAAGPAGAVGFEDASDRLNDFVHNSLRVNDEGLPAGGEGLAGAAWLDYDADGELDLFLTNGKGSANALFENDGDGGFTNVAADAGVDDTMGHAGAVAGDIDNDGFPDLFLTGEGHCNTGQTPTVLYHNNGDGTFTDIAAEAGVQASEPAWSAAFADIDNDGDLDLFVTGTGNICTGERNPNRLYRNDGEAGGDLTFTEIGADAGVNTDLAACAAAFADFNDDGWQDLLVANCNSFPDDPPFLPIPEPVELYINDEDGTFTNIAPQAGLTRPGFWMSATVGDYDGDGDIDIFSDNAGLAFGTPNALYRNNGDGTFSDVTEAAGLRPWEFGWGATSGDFDNDGDLDIFYTGSLPFLLNPAVPWGIVGRLATPGRLFLNDGEGNFTERSDLVPVDLAFDYPSGVARADFDQDGFVDIVVQRDAISEELMATLEDAVFSQFSGLPAASGEPVLLRNAGNANNWLTVRLEGTASNRQGIGARIRVERLGPRGTPAPDAPDQIREVRAGSSFASSETPWPTFGLGQSRVAAVHVDWPSGVSEFFVIPRLNRMVTLSEGSGVSLPEGR